MKTGALPSRRVCLGAAFGFMAAGLVWRLVPSALPILALRVAGPPVGGYATRGLAAVPVI